MTRKPQSTLFRIVVSDDKKLSVCDKKTGSGRSVYVCKDSECILKAIKKRGINRSLKSDIPGEVQEAVYERLLEEVKDKTIPKERTGPTQGKAKADRYIGLARKGSNLAAGYDTCIELIRKKKVHLLIITEDVSGKTKEKFYGLSERNNIPIFTYGSSDHMSHIAGMPNRNIFAILDRNLAKAVKDELSKGDDSSE